jgi:hypothetical protein
MVATTSEPDIAMLHAPHNAPGCLQNENRPSYSGFATIVIDGSLLARNRRRYLFLLGRTKWAAQPVP